MFCPKCGARVSDDAGFCQKCGTKLKPGNTAQSAVDDSSNPVKQDAGTSKSASKKKKKKLPIILGVVVGLILLLVILASIGGSEEPNDQPQQPSERVNTDVDLSETYINTDAGISFSYPANWTITEEGDMKIVDMMDSDNAPGHRILLQVNNILDTDPFNIFSGDAASIETAVNDLHTFLSVEDDAIGGVPVRILKYRTEGLGGDEIVQNYYYTNGDNRYLIQCTYSASLADTCEKLFYEIIGSYTITAPSEPAEPTESVRNYAEVTWEELMRYPEDYIGKGVSISSVTVSQIFKDSNEISVIDSDYNAFIIDYSGCGIERVLEDDPVSIQGVYQGATEMTRAIGDVTVDLPLIKADSIVVEGLVDREAWLEDHYVGTWQDATGAYQMEITFNGDVFSLEASYQNDNTGDWRMWSLEGWQEGNFDAVPSIFLESEKFMCEGR